MKLMASLAPAQAEVEAGVVAKADQKEENVMNSGDYVDWHILQCFWEVQALRLD